MIHKQGQKIIITEDQTETKIRQMLDEVLLRQPYANVPTQDILEWLGVIFTWLGSVDTEPLTEAESSTILAAVIELIARQEDS